MAMSVKKFVKRVLPYRILYPLQRLRIGLRYFWLYSMSSIFSNYKAHDPVRVRIEPASACNLRCGHCPTGAAAISDNPNRGIMKLDLFNRLIPQIAAMKGIRAATLYLAGEPLLNKHFAVMLRRVKEETNISSTTFTTNGMLLDEKACNALKSADVDVINVSLDGNSPEENDKIRTRSNFQRVRTNIHQARKTLEGTKIFIHNIIVPPLEKMLDRPRPPKYLTDEFGTQNVQSFMAIRWPGIVGSYLVANNMEIVKKNAVGTSTGEYFCNSPFVETVVESDGKVTVCCYNITHELMMGNVNETPLSEIWNGEKYRKLRKAIATFGLLEELPETCKKCTIYSGEVLVKSLPEGVTPAKAPAKPRQAPATSMGN
jgi:radical SAM protein with 4Fe4S-binding SPASM domain